MKLKTERKEMKWGRKIRLKKTNLVWPKEENRATGFVKIASN